eukprot:15474373-Alexandrium_andersonii.AAC.1
MGGPFSSSTEPPPPAPLPTRSPCWLASGSLRQSWRRLGRLIVVLPRQSAPFCCTAGPRH